MTNTVAASPVDVNVKFAEERADLLAAGAERQAEFDARLAAGKLRSLGNGRFKVTDPGSWDNGEILTVEGGRVMPQHQLDLSTGQAALYTSVPAWHALGNVVPGGTTDVDEVLRLGRIDYTVEKRPSLFERRDGSIGQNAGRFTTVRTDTEDGLGDVGARYEVLQNREAFAFLQEMVESDSVIWESAGALRGGRKVFACMRLPEDIVIDAAGVADSIRPFACAINSHDGDSPFRVITTPWRPVCGNTERFAVRDAVSSFSVRHTAQMRDRAELARKTLGLSTSYYTQWAAEEEKLAQTELLLDDFHQLLDELWTPPEDDASDRTRSRYVGRRDRLTEFWESNTYALGRTAYAAERAVTEYLDWGKTVRPTESLRGNNLAVRATAMLEGSNDDTKSRVHRQLLLRVRGAQ